MKAPGRTRTRFVLIGSSLAHFTLISHTTHLYRNKKTHEKRSKLTSIRLNIRQMPERLRLHGTPSRCTLDPAVGMGITKERNQSRYTRSRIPAAKPQRKTLSSSLFRCGLRSRHTVNCDNEQEVRTRVYCGDRNCRSLPIPDRYGEAAHTAARSGLP